MLYWPEALSEILDKETHNEVMQNHFLVAGVITHFYRYKRACTLYLPGLS